LGIEKLRWFLLSVEPEKELGYARAMSKRTPANCLELVERAPVLRMKSFNSFSALLSGLNALFFGQARAILHLLKKIDWQVNLSDCLWRLP
jgi:hypothetical protein